MKTTPNGVVYMHFTKRIINKFKVSREDAAALVSCMSNIRNHPFWITFVDYPDNIRVRLRSRTIAINEIGKKYRGGGHLQACGATIYNKKEMKAILADLDTLHANFKENHKDLE
jgi:phosphoesterase RecJ-like protein